MSRDLIDGRYRLERQLGHGPMGEVWRATDVELERPVALKLLAPDADRARFEREARAAAALSHPNVTRIYDYGETAGRPYMALEFLPGGTLEERLPPERRLDDDETSAIAVELAAGLAHAHAHGLVHRDLKPANILFDDAGRAKIADFGIARLGSAATLTEAGTVLGTAAYISPEQAAGEPATPASDVYSFGVVLFRMLTGRLPFEADSPLELVDMHRRLDAPPVEIVRPDAPPRLAALTAAALARDPAARPPDGTALAAALGTAPPATNEPTLVMRRAKESRTRAAVVVGVLAVVGVAGAAAAFLLTRDTSTAPAAPTQRATRSVPTTTTPVPAPTPPTTTTERTTTAATTTAPPPPPITSAPNTTIPTPTDTTLPTTIATTTTVPIP